MTVVFANQGWGNLAAALVSLAVVNAFRSEIESANINSSVVAVDACWRLLIGLGCVPGAYQTLVAKCHPAESFCLQGVVALYFRLTIPETPRFTLDIERNVTQVRTDRHP